MIVLSILIPSLHKRSGMLNALVSKLSYQIEQCAADDKVEILTAVDDGSVTTGNKRNNLVRLSRGKYVVHVDDDDDVSDEYISSILEAAQHDCDAIVFAGWMTTDGLNRKDWYISKNNPYCAATRLGKEVYLRYPNHIVPIKREIVLQVPFPNKTREEDFDFATRLHKLGLVKTESKIDKFLYHYKFCNIKP